MRHLNSYPRVLVFFSSPLPFAFHSDFELVVCIWTKAPFNALACRKFFKRCWKAKVNLRKWLNLSLKSSSGDFNVAMILFYLKCTSPTPPSLRLLISPHDSAVRFGISLQNAMTYLDESCCNSFQHFLFWQWGLVYTQSACRCVPALASSHFRLNTGVELKQKSVARRFQHHRRWTALQGSQRVCVDSSHWLTH